MEEEKIEVEQKPKTYKIKNKTTFKIYNIKDTFVRIFLEYIKELNKIPSAKDRMLYLRKTFYRNVDNRAEFNILHGYFIKRLLFSPITKERFLPLESDLQKDSLTGKVINMPQLDFMVEYGVNEPEMRKYFEEYIYSEESYLQSFLTSFINGDNIYKIPKSMLKELWDNKKLRMNKYMTINDMEVLHRHFIGFPPETHKAHIYKFLDLKSFNGTKFTDITIPTNKEVNDYFKTDNKSNRTFYTWTRKLQLENFGTKFYLRFPVVLYIGSLKKKRKLLWFVRLGSLERTNIEGMLLNYFRTVFRRGMVSRRFLFVGYLNEDNSLDIMVCTNNETLCKSFVTEKAFNINYNRSLLTKDFKELRKNMEFYAKEFSIKKLKLYKQQGHIFSSLHYLLNYILLNVQQYQQRDITILFRNFMMISNQLKPRKAIMTEHDTKHKSFKFIYLDTKEQITLHNSRISEDYEIIPNFLNKECLVFEFERGGRFALLAPMKNFKFYEEKYTKDIEKLRLFKQNLNKDMII